MLSEKCFGYRTKRKPIGWPHEALSFVVEGDVDDRRAKLCQGWFLGMMLRSSSKH